MSIYNRYRITSTSKLKPSGNSGKKLQIGEYIVPAPHAMVWSWRFTRNRIKVPISSKSDSSNKNGSFCAGSY